jgi:hypothetical protein
MNGYASIVYRGNQNPGMIENGLQETIAEDPETTTAPGYHDAATGRQSSSSRAGDSRFELNSPN